MKALEAQINAIAKIVECDKVTEDDYYAVRRNLKDNSERDPIVDSISQLADTNTTIAKSTPVTRRLLI